MEFEFKDKAEGLRAMLANPELDHIKSEVTGALREIKEKTGNADMAATLLEKGIQGLRRDLRELGIDAAQWEGYERIYQEEFKKTTRNLEGAAITESMEVTKLDTFIAGYAKYARLDSIIEQCKGKQSSTPLRRFLRTIQSNTSILEGIGTGLLKWLGLDKKDSKKPDHLADRAHQADEVLTEDEEEADEDDREDKQEEEPDKKKETDSKSKKVRGSASSFSGTTEINGKSGVKYEMKAEYARKLTPAEFKEAYRKLGRFERYGLILQQIRFGNGKITFHDVTSEAPDGTKVTIKVGRITVCGMPVQLDGPSALAAARLMGCTLPTDWVTEQRWKQIKASDQTVKKAEQELAEAQKKGVGVEAAKEKLKKAQEKATGRVVPFYSATDMGIPTDAEGHPNGTMMMSSEFAMKRAERIEKWKKEHGVGEDQDTDGDFKEVVLPVPGVTLPGHLAFTGGRDKQGKNIQGELGGGAHEGTYSDLSHGVLAVKDEKGESGSVTITEKGSDGQMVTKKMSATEFYSNPDYAKRFGFRIPSTEGYEDPALNAFVKGEEPKDAKNQPKQDGVQATMPQPVASVVPTRPTGPTAPVASTESRGPTGPTGPVGPTATSSTYIGPTGPTGPTAG